MAMVFQVIHDYDVDGGFGDAVGCSDVIATFKDQKDAEAFIEHFARPIVYDKPYSELHCGELRMEPVQIIEHNDLWKFHKNQFWWLSCEDIR